MLARINAAKNNDKGFTLIELLVVIIIIGILSAVAIPLFLNQQKKAQDAAAKADVSTIGKEIATYLVDWDGTTAPVVSLAGGKYTLTAGTAASPIGNASANVALGTLKTTVTDINSAAGWCVSVKNPKGDKSNATGSGATAVGGFKYSAAGGLQEGQC